MEQGDLGRPPHTEERARDPAAHSLKGLLQCDQSCPISSPCLPLHSLSSSLPSITVPAAPHGLPIPSPMTAAITLPITAPFITRLTPSYC